MAIVQRILRYLGDRQASRWDRFGGPGPVLRWCFRHPWSVTIVLASILAVALGAVFGVPPFSPLVLVIVVVAPVAPVLQVLARMHTRWRERPPEAPRSPGGPEEPDTPGTDPPIRTDGPAPGERP